MNKNSQEQKPTAIPFVGLPNLQFKHIRIFSLFCPSICIVPNWIVHCCGDIILINCGFKEVMVCQAASQTRFRAMKHESGIAGSAAIIVRVIACFQQLQICQAEYFRQLLKPVT